MLLSTIKLIRYSLGIVLLLVAINALGGGYYGMAGAKDIPIEWLKGSPFRNYFHPSLILFIFVGGSSLTAAIAVFKRLSQAKFAAYLSGIIILVWISVQLLIIGCVSWMQPTIAVTGLIILFLTWLLPKHEF